MPLSEAQILAIIQANKALGSDPNRVEITDLAKILDALENDILNQISGSGLVVGGTPATGKVPKWNGSAAVWDTDLTANPGTGGTLDEVLTNGNTTDESIIFDKTLTTPVTNGQSVGHTWLNFAPLAKTGETGSKTPANFFFHQRESFQDNSVNQVVHFGWNIADGGGNYNPILPAIGESWEANYQPFTNRWVEKHEFYVTPNTFTAAPSTQIRLSSYTIDSITGGIDYYHTVGRHYYKRPYEADATATYFSIQPAGLFGATIELSATSAKNFSISYDYTAGVTMSGNGIDTGFKRLILQNFEEVIFSNAGFRFSSSAGAHNFRIDAGSAVFDPQTADAVDIGVESRNFKTGYFKQLGWRTKAGNPVACVPPK